MTASSETGLFQSLPLSIRPPRKRKRDREDAGKSPSSWKKHALVMRAFSAQFFAFLKKHPHARCLIIDMNAGDGEGVEIAREQLAFAFIERPISTTTAELATKQSARNIDVILCEKNKIKAAKLRERFNKPGIRIIGDHANVLPFVAGYDYVIVLSDPCGPAGHGERTMAAISRLVPKADFVIALNEYAVRRINGTHRDEAEVGRPGKANATSRRLHGWKDEPLQWRMLLVRKHVAVSKGDPISISQGFGLRLLVVSDFPVVKESQFEVLA